MAQKSPEKRNPPPAFLAFLVGLALGVLISAGVALYVTHMPSPFVERGVQSSDAPEKPIATVPAVSSQGLMNPIPVAPGSSPPPEVPAAQTPPASPATTPETPVPPPAPTASQPPQGTDSKPTLHSAQTTWFIQTGAFGKASEAENQRGQLALVGVDATVLSPTTSDGKSLYRVRIGPLTNQDEVQALVATLRNSGFSTNVTKSSEPSLSR